MKILSIETSCDETSIAVLECTGNIPTPQFKVLGHALYSQVETHAKYGGVYPNLAKREHQINFTPLLISALDQAKLLEDSKQYTASNLQQEKINEARLLLERESGVAEILIDFLSTHDKPKIDAIAVTKGPGLEPALWVGIQCAETLSRVWQLPLYGINHMEGHIFSVLIDNNPEKEYSNVLTNIRIDFPVLALLVSGGHTQLVKSDEMGKYSLLGETRDDAAGECFDKVARILGLPYPGGPQISRLAREARDKMIDKKFNFPRPMINTPNFDFSFSGLKTHVLYALQKHGELKGNEKLDAAREVEDAICDVLVAKTRIALNKYTEIKTLIVAGGVASNQELRNRISVLENEFGIKILFPTFELSTDNAIMIGIVAFVRFLLGDKGREKSTFLKAEGRLSLN